MVNKSPTQFLCCITQRPLITKRETQKHTSRMTQWVSYSVKTEVKRGFVIKDSAIRDTKMCVFFKGIPLWDTVAANLLAINWQKATDLWIIRGWMLDNLSKIMSRWFYWTKSKETIFYLKYCKEQKFFYHSKCAMAWFSKELILHN